MNIALVITLSILAQLSLTITYAKEALTTKEGVYCEVKCALAGTTYLAFAIFLAWILFHYPLIN